MGGWKFESGRGNRRAGAQWSEEAGFQRVAVRTIPHFGHWRIAAGGRAVGIAWSVPQEFGFDLLLRRKSDEDPGGLERSPR